MIEFEEAWETLGEGDPVRVSNGKPQPPGDGLAFKIWKSHNFEGVVVERIGGPPRALRIELPKVDGARVSYTIVETFPDKFERL